MGRRRGRKVEPTEVSKDIVERQAEILGPFSAAARALKDAETHSGPVRFWSAPGLLLVEKLPEIR